MEAGKAYHDTVAKLYNLDHHPTIEEVKDTFITVKKKYEVEEPDKLMKMVEAYVTELMPLHEPFRVEQFAETEIAPDIYLRGYIDLITTDDVIVDHKTAARRWPVYRAHKDLQPVAYYILYESLMGKPPRKFEFHIVTKAEQPKVQVMETSRSSDTLEWYKEGLVANLDAVNSGVFPPNPTYQYCSRKFCAFWQPCHRSKLYVPF